MTQEENIAALALKLKELALARRATVGTAESCTGGLIAAAITAVPGSSEYFLGGVVSYANSVKARLLGVPEEILGTVGAVSGECARFMAARKNPSARCGSLCAVRAGRRPMRVVSPAAAPRCARRRQRTLCRC